MDGDTSLIVACDWGQLSAAERLIDMKADVNYQNKVSLHLVTLILQVCS